MLCADTSCGCLSGEVTCTLLDPALPQHCIQGFECWNLSLGHSIRHMAAEGWCHYRGDALTASLPWLCNASASVRDRHFRKLYQTTWKPALFPLSHCNHLICILAGVLRPHLRQGWCWVGSLHNGGVMIHTPVGWTSPVSMPAWTCRPPADPSLHV